MSGAEDPDYIFELFSVFGPVSVRRMFGGAGISADGINFAIVFDGVIYLKVDQTTIPEFKRDGSAPFVYPRAKNPARTGRPSQSYWQLPERLYDDPGELARWAAQALEVARLTAQKKPPARRPRTKAKTAHKRASKKQIGI